MATQPTPPRLAPEIESLLVRLRRRIRRYVWFEGIAVAIAWLGLAFWLSLLVDQPWVWEPPVQARAVVLTGVGLLLLYIAYRFIVRRAFVPLPRRSMAVLLERRFDQFDDALLTAVELTDRPAEGSSPEMLAHTCGEALDRSDKIDLDQVFNPAPLVRAVVAAGLLTASVVCFAVVLPDPFGIWARRNLLLSAELWPRKTELTVEGFEGNVAKIARGSDLGIVVRANTAKLVPDSVQIRYRTDEGARGRVNMTRDGVADPQKDPFQQFSHTFQGVLTPIEFDVLGGDDRKRDLRIEVVDSPTISETVLACRYPAYMKRDARDVPVTGVMQLPEGTQVVLKARANKDLVQVQIDYPLAAADQKEGAEKVPADQQAEGEGRATEVIQMAERGGDRRTFEFSLGELKEDTTLLFTLLDADGIVNREPFRLALGVVPDEPPQVSIRLRGIGSAITPQARIPVRGAMTDENGRPNDYGITDDYGVADAWFEYVVDEETAPQRRPLARPTRGRNRVKFGDANEEALDVKEDLVADASAPDEGTGDEAAPPNEAAPPAAARKLELKPGQKLSLAIKAQDNYGLGPPHERASQRYLLDIVTPDQLRAILESRELNLRRRFETIVEELTDTRNSIVLLKFGARAATPPTPGSESDKQAGATEGAKQAGTEPGDKEDSPADRLSLALLRVERAVQNSRKNAQETLGVAQEFSNIREELINNRVDTEELKSRLKEGIADPLRSVADTMFPELDKRLEKLRADLSKPVAAETRDAAVAQADRMLVEMRQILDKMLELETFNEALALLRSILESQDELNRHTEEVRKQQLRELLE